VLGLGKKVDDKMWLEIVKEVDGDGDGEISFAEFKNMMNKMLEFD
jgi:Ca2+-binding EF-hand superfamily protein